jgi:hypothetical protein
MRYLRSCAAVEQVPDPQWFRTPEGVGHTKQAMASLLGKDDPALFAKYGALKKED